MILHFDNRKDVGGSEINLPLILCRSAHSSWRIMCGADFCRWFRVDFVEGADSPSSEDILLILEVVLTSEMDSLGGKIQIKPSPRNISVQGWWFQGSCAPHQPVFSGELLAKKKKSKQRLKLLNSKLCKSFCWPSKGSTRVPQAAVLASCTNCTKPGAAQRD